MEKQGYFDDLEITHTDDRVFNGSYVHRLHSFKQNTFSLEMISEGEVDLKLDQHLVHLKAPVVFCTGDNNQFYRFYYSGEKSTYRHLWIDFHGERGRRIYAAFLRRDPFGKITPPGTEKEILSLFEEIHQAFQTPEKFNHDQAVLQLEKMVYLCLSRPSSLTVTEEDPFRLRQICETVLKDPFQAHSTKFFAAERNISQVYLRQLFRERFGISVNQFIFRARMEMAAELASSQRYRISELAEMCRFSDISAFSRAFKRLYGSSPKKYSQSPR